MRTKWDVLVEQRDNAAQELAKREAILSGYEATVCGLLCAGCQTMLATEADFAKHFLIPDERYLNLGDCPNRVR